FFFFQAEDGIRDFHVTGVQTCALPISRNSSITTRSHATAWARASSRSAVTTTPLPAARPSSLTTYGGPKASSAAAASAGVVQTRSEERRVGKGWVTGGGAWGARG